MNTTHVTTLSLDSVSLSLWNHWYYYISTHLVATNDTAVGGLRQDRPLPHTHPARPARPGDPTGTFALEKALHIGQLVSCVVVHSPRAERLFRAKPQTRGTKLAAEFTR